MDLELCARYRLGESAGVLERDGGVGVPVVGMPSGLRTISMLTCRTRLAQPSSSGPP
jgi:hypothetical protein